MSSQLSNLFPRVQQRQLSKDLLIENIQYPISSFSLFLFFFFFSSSSFLFLAFFINYYLLYKLNNFSIPTLLFLFVLFLFLSFSFPQLQYRSTTTDDECFSLTAAQLGFVLKERTDEYIQTEMRGNDFFSFTFHIFPCFASSIYLFSLISSTLTLRKIGRL